MTVGELIAKLSIMDPDKPVGVMVPYEIDDYDSGYEFEPIDDISESDEKVVLYYC